MTNIFVGNLSYETSQEDLEAAFNEFGAVERVNIVRDRDTGQPRGFAASSVRTYDSTRASTAARSAWSEIPWPERLTSTGSR